MSQKKITAKRIQLMAASVVTVATIIGISNGQNIQKTMAQGSNSIAKEEANEYKNTAAVSSSSTTASASELARIKIAYLVGISAF